MKYKYEILMKFQSSATQAVNFELLIFFLSFFFNLSFPNNVFPEKKILSPLIFGSLRGNLVLVEGIFSRISRKEQDSAPTLHTKENPGWRFFKEVTYAKYENGLKILRWWEFWLNRLFSWVGVGVWGSAPPPPSYDFFENSPHQNRCPPLGTPPLKNEVSPTEKQTQPLKSEAPFRKWFLEKE